MSNAFFQVPIAKNEPVLSYSPGSKEKLELKKALKTMKATSVDIPMYIGSQKIYTQDKRTIHPPHERNFTLGTYSHGDATHVSMAIDAALAAKKDWENITVKLDILSKTPSAAMEILKLKLAQNH